MGPAGNRYAWGMASVEEHLRRWLTAGIVDEPLAERVRQFERSQPAPARPGPSLLEALVYLGIAVVGVGVAILVGSNWDDLEEWSRVSVYAVPGVLALAAGVGLQRTREAALDRGAQVAWLAGGALVAGSAAIAASNAGWAEENVVLAAGTVGTVLALLLWALSPEHPQVVGIAAALFLLSMAFGARWEDFNMQAAFLSLATFGVAGIGLAEYGLLRPRVSARAVGAIGVAVGAFFAVVEQGWAEPAPFIAGVALIALSIRLGVFLYVIFGVGAVFAGLIYTVARHAGNSTQASAALIVIGALMVATVLILAQTRPWLRRKAA